MGRLALTPAAFMALTPAEFHLLHQGWEDREERRTETIAQWAAVLINGMGWRKSPITAQQLLGRPLRAERELASAKASAQE